jgi:hypothetical protein
MLVGVKCDDIGAYADEFSFEECIACSLAGGPRKCHAPTALLVAMAQAQHDRKDAGISATMLLDCPRKVALQTTEDWYEHPADFWSRFRGTLAHMALEHYAVDAEHLVNEVRRRKTYEVDGVEIAITGKPDHVDVSRGLILDFKTCQSVGAKPVGAGKPKDGHEAQVNIYADLCDGGVNMTTGEFETIEVTRGGIVYLDMKSYRKVPVNIWPAEERRAFIVERLRPIADYRRTGVLPGLLYDTERPTMRSWKCASKWCALREHCDLAAGRGE